MLEDKLLVWKIKRGEREAMRELYQRYKDDLLTIAVSLLNEPATAEDVLHDVFISFVTGIDNFELYGNLKNYLATCLVNRVRDRFRAKQFEVVGLDSTGPLSPELDEPEDTAMAKEQSQILTDALTELPLQQCEVIVLHLQAGMKFREIAEMQDVSMNTIQSRYRYGLEKLRSILDLEVIE